jgi:hypothetical protein
VWRPVTLLWTSFHTLVYPWSYSLSLSVSFRILAILENTNLTAWQFEVLVFSGCAILNYFFVLLHLLYQLIDRYLGLFLYSYLLVRHLTLIALHQVTNVNSDVRGGNFELPVKNPPLNPIFNVFEFEWLLIDRHRLPPYRWEEVWAPQWTGELCWWERKLLVGPPMPDKLWGRGQTNEVPGPPGWGLGVELMIPPGKKCTVTKPWRR